MSAEFEMPTSVCPLEMACKKGLADAAGLADEEDICIGMYSDFSLEDFERDINYSYFVMNDRVFVHGLESLEHGSVVGKIAFHIGIALRSKGLPIEPGSGAGRMLYTSDCGSKFIKNPDASFYSRIDKSLAPYLVVEVAMHHETFSQLLHEASAWLNCYSGTQYCIIVKVFFDRQDFRALFFLLEKSQRTAAPVPDTSHQMASSKPKCISVPSKKSFVESSPEELESYFKFRVLEYVVITEENLSQPIQFSFYYNGTLVEVSLPENIFEPAYQEFISRRSRI